jgi:hypothetical protein
MSRWRDLFEAIGKGRDTVDVVDAVLAPALPPDGSPTGPCPACGARLYWRASIMSGGPGPWTCQKCAPPEPELWIDACGLPGPRT